MQLFIVRHGETEENKKHILQGHLEGHLTDEGKKQADETGEKLSDIGFDILLCSDLKRCIDTANIINKHLKIKMQTTPLLRERDWGSATGMIVDSTHRITIPSDAETVESMLRRARIFLDFVSSAYKGKRVLAVSHGLFCRALQAVLKDVELGDISRMANGEYRILEL